MKEYSAGPKGSAIQIGPHVITFSLLMPICSFSHGSHGASKYAMVLMKVNDRE